MVAIVLAIQNAGDKPAVSLKTVSSNSFFECYVYSESTLIGAGRALTDGLDGSYICDIAVHPDFQGMSLDKQIVENLIKQLRCGSVLQYLFKELLSSIHFGIREEFHWGVLLNNFASVHKDDAISDFFRKAHFVGDTQHGHTFFC